MFRTHNHLPLIPAYRLFNNSETPWIMSRAAATGMTVLNGYRGGRHGLTTDSSRILQEWRASWLPNQKKRIIPGKKKKM
jgi:hypothetical protein